MFELFVVKNFLDEATRRAVVAELRAGVGGPATVYGKAAAGAVEPLVRRVTRVNVSPETRRLVARLLDGRRGEIGEHFGEAVGGCEEPQFLRYGAGDFFVAHQDGNTPLVHDDSRFRRVSAVVFLSPQSDEPAPGAYGGGSLVLYGPRTNPDLRHPVAAEPGTLVAFRSETTHEVTPVLHGERYTIASWYRTA
ncbi:MAG TPA: 2OG-Fe(II) oxygenase [Pyrinomonadaceae bacterium]|nr:2OG-Fe(II) oxygenase [Pyrinomonadaceae bacterium]